MKKTTKPSMAALLLPLFLFLFLSILALSNGVSDTIAKTQSIKEGQTIVSPSQSFELGFFQPPGSENRYLGIWYKMSIVSVVWVANRETPIPDSSGTLKFDDGGKLVLLNGQNKIVWSATASRSARDPVLQLLDTGNLVVREANDVDPANFLWQSFDNPSDTFLPGMKLGRSLSTGQVWNITSWNSKDDPTRGPYTYWLDVRGYPQIFISKDSAEVFRTGPWNGLQFSGSPRMADNAFNFQLYFQNDAVYYRYENASAVSRVLMNSDGTVQRLTWDKDWVLKTSDPTDTCDQSYNRCGPYGSCNVDNSILCTCLNKFVAKNQQAWDMTIWSDGCIRQTPLNCKNGDGFAKYSGMKLPDTRISQFNKTMTLRECRELCLQNCSCMAYSSLDISGGGSGCLLWFGDLVDMRYSKDNGQDLYIRMASSDSDPDNQQDSAKGRKKMILIVCWTVSAGLLLLCLTIILYVRKKKKKKNSRPRIEKFPRSLVENSQDGSANQGQNEDLELPLFDFHTIAKSTNDFSVNNKLGEGGFGPVYKGRLEGGEEIAVKRLSQYSRQGLNEFKTEVICIARLQHRNLVRLLGCCIQEEEKMLIYEFMPNKSLDSFIFDEQRKTLLDWPKRFDIINGIARGLLYLHQDSRLRIIHRDLKASNILLDADLNPKISDFGMAKSFAGDETRGNTRRVVGTYGYMSPEYQVDGVFSVKSDVFSFGVIVLEIVGGKRNRGFFHPEHQLNLLGHAWMLYEEGRALELIDETVKGSCQESEVLRSIHVGLLCVQQRPEDRPKMSSVVLMLRNKNTLPRPKEPGFFTQRNNPSEADTSSSKQAPSSTSASVHDFTITVMEPR
ncbi:Non-specific serine/threonine protein kinase [Bertholletia excelsa]